VYLDDPADWPDNDLAEHLAIGHGIVAARLTRKARVALGLAGTIFASGRIDLKQKNDPASIRSEI